ncbi:hypothetical protein BRARA_I02042 [Brassica rapa]|uniref:Uncharacterized protein n=1 Tax=Brassica campestris TaxID=3711 RepID=A0A397Y3B3_BRACM|nr:hypothetical protein BRARA_I02042 [Brassica rapa]
MAGVGLFSLIFFLFVCVEKENLCLYGHPSELWEVNETLILPLDSIRFLRNPPWMLNELCWTNLWAQRCWNRGGCSVEKCGENGVGHSSGMLLQRGAGDWNEVFGDGGGSERSCDASGENREDLRLWTGDACLLCLITKWRRLMSRQKLKMCILLCPK